MLHDIYTALTNRSYCVRALRVAAIVGSLLFVINHGSAFVNGKMSRDRWFSAVLTYCVPYLVSIHGQSTGAQTTHKP